MKSRSRPFDCVIAAKTVGIALRHGGGLQEPDRVYVRCDERDCQYVDLNEAPCPLRPEMFADGSDDRVAQYLESQANVRFCYACLTEKLGVTHDQVRRASWRMKDEPGFAIRPARCAVCHLRRVTVILHREGAAPARWATTHKPDVQPVKTRPNQELEEYLRRHAGYGFCAHCLAGALKGRPADIREEMWDLEGQPAFQIRTAQCVKCLMAKPVIKFEEAATGADLPRRVIELLLKTPDLRLCATCAAFSTDLGLADVRRVFQQLAGVEEFVHADGACAVCGRWNTVLGVQIRTENDAEHVAQLSEVLTGVVRHRGFRIDLLSFKTSEGWRPFALVKSGVGTLVPDAPPIILGMMPSKAEADEFAAFHAREWIDKHFG